MADTRALDIQVSMNTAQLNSDIGRAKGLVATFNSEIRRSDAEMKTFGKTTETLGTKKEALTKKFEAQGKQMELLNQAYDEQVKSSGDSSKQTLKLERDINNLAAQMAKTEGDIEAVNSDLADYADVAGKSGTSTVELYGKIGSASDQLKTYESELKKSSSELEVFGASSETLGGKLIALNNVYDGQKAKMDVLKEAYDREVEKSGEASSSAQKLSQEIGNLSSEMSKTQGEIKETSSELADYTSVSGKSGSSTVELREKINNAGNQLKTYESELKRSSSEVQAFGKSSDTLGNKLTALNKVYDGQSSKMDLLNEAYDREVKKSGEASSSAQKLSQEINSLSGEMSKTKAEIEATTSELIDYTDVAGKAGTSTVALKERVNETDQQLKTYESELKKANSEVKIFGETSETLGNKLTALNNVYDGQKDKMAALEAAYTREVSKSGEASKAAQQLSREMNTLETSMNATQGEIKETSNELENINGVAPNTAANIDLIASSLKAMVMEKVLQYLDNVADKMLEIGANAVTTAADIQAHDSLFEQVFSRMSDGAGGQIDKIDEAYKKVQQLYEYSGKLPTSLEEGFLQMSQQFMSVDMEGVEALDLAERAMRMTTDAAAAYNVELDQAQDLIQSFVSGNNKAGKSLGIYATETQLMSYAVEKGFIEIGEQQKQFAIDSNIKVAKAQQNYDKILASSKSTPVDIADAQNKLTKAIEEQEEGLQVSQRAWTDLDGAIKQAARVDYIENVYEMNGVMGQAAVEADQWETATGNLAEAQRRLNGAIGEAALEMLIPIIQLLTDVIMKLVTWYENLSPAMQKFITIAALVMFIAIKVAVFIGKLSVVAMLLRTDILGLVSGFATLVGPILAVIVVVGLIIAAILSSETAMNWLKDAWEVTKNFLIGVWEAISGAVMEVWDGITQWITENQESISKVIERVWDAIGAIISAALAFIVPIFQGAWIAIKLTVAAVWDFLVTLIGSALKIIWKIIEVFLAALEGDWGQAWEKIKELLMTTLTAIIDVVVSTFTGIVDIVMGIMLFLSSIIYGAMTAIASLWMSIWNGIKALVMSVLSALMSFIINTLTAIGKGIMTGLTAIGTFFSNVWESIKFATTLAWQLMLNTVTKFVSGIYDSVVEWIGNVGTWWSEAWGSIKQFFSDAWNSIKEILTSVKKPIDSVIGYFNGLWESAKSVFENVKNKVNETWESVKNTIGKLNPANWFGAQHVVKVSYDADPYNPAMGAFQMSSAPVPIFSSAIGSLMSASSSIIGGMNSAYNNLDGIYESGVVIVNAPQEKDDRNQLILNDRLDRLERLLTIIAEKELNAYLDSREVTSKLYNPMQNEAQMRDAEKSRTIGVW